MKKLIAFTVACVFCLPAYAADLPNRAAPPVFVPPVLDSWTGCYVGGFGGIDIANVVNSPHDARADSFVRSVVGPGVPFFRPLPSPPGVVSFRVGNTFTRTTTVTNLRAQNNAPYSRAIVGPDGGGRVGCNYQTGKFVFGAQLEGGYLGVNGSSIDPIRPTSTSRIDGGPYGALTGRIGYAVYERTLIYVRGGVGYADLKYSTFDPLLGFNAAVRRGEAMPLIGGGLEYKITPQISLTGEYTYLRPGCRTLAYTFNGVGGGTSTSCVEKQMITLGLNYYFTSAATPVVARY